MDRLIIFAEISLFLSCPAYSSVDIDLEECSLRCGSSSHQTRHQHTSRAHEHERCPQSAFVFPRKSAIDYLRVKSPFVATSEFTMCVWATAYGTGAFTGSLLSYATADDNNKIVILFHSQGGHFIMAGLEQNNVQHPLKAGTENFICVVMGGPLSVAKLYVNGTRHASLRFGNTAKIPTGGAFVIGQEQDSLLGGFDRNQAFQGEIRNYMIWNRLLTNEEVEFLAQSKTNCLSDHSIALTPSRVQFEGVVNSLIQDPC